MVAAVDNDAPHGVAQFVAGITRLDAVAREAIRERWDEDEFGAKLYAEHHAGELGDDALSDVDTLLSRLQLVRAGFEPDDPERYVALDYTIGEELTQYLLVVAFDEDGEITDVVMES